MEEHRLSTCALLFPVILKKTVHFVAALQNFRL
jgi:hypothetical protein